MASRARRRTGWIVVGILLALLVTLLTLARFYTDVLWFREIGLTSVLWTSLGTQFFVGLAVGVLTAAIVAANLFLAARLAPAYGVLQAEGRRRPDPFDRYREALTPYLRWLRLGIAAFIGVSAGISASASWRIYLLWANRVSFGIDDPQFDRDIGFYVFELPFWDVLLDWAWYALVAALLVTLAAHYFHRSIRPEAGLAGVLPGALAHVSVLLGLLALVKAAQYWLGRYQLNFSTRGVVTGASYTDINAQLPALTLLTVISIISALLFLINIRFRTLRLPLAAIGIWIAFALLAGGVWPWWVQRFSVDPQELQRERPFIERNLDATRKAFGLDDVVTRTFPARSDLTAEDIEANDSLIQNVRLWDPGVLKLAYEQLQAIRTYYKFEDVDIDRYEVDGETRQVLLATRELDTEDLPERSKTWANVHLQFTHGFGLVASLANEATAAGQPLFLVKDVPGLVRPGAESLEAEQPRIYYGEGYGSNEYSVVNSQQEELDYPLEEGAARSNYEGAGGIPMGGLFRRTLFAIREGDPNLVLSSLISGDSRILIYKDVRDRVLRAAPFLALDHDPYPAVIDGRLLWILDAYTSTPYYPYSERFDLGQIVASDESGTVSGDANYLRNSVKVVVDAYDGTMDFFIVDDSDPLILAWRSAFPDLFTDEEPSDELREHFRYPEDLFKVQSEVYLTYHMTEPDDFYSKEDEWEVADNPVDVGTTAAIERPPFVPPTYLLIQLPGETENKFLISRPFTPRGRNNMIALMLAESDPDGYGEMVTLQFPRTANVLGPVQINNLINQEVEISQTLSLLRQGGSNVDFGALVNLPIEDSVLYIQPLFVTAETVGIPELKRVVVILGEEVIMGDSFEDALLELFGVAEEPPPDDEEPEPGPPAEGRLRRLIARAGRVYEQAQQALARGDFGEYGQLIEELGDILRRAEAAGEQSPSGPNEPDPESTVTPSPEPTGSP